MIPVYSWEEQTKNNRILSEIKEYHNTIFENIYIGWNYNQMKWTCLIPGPINTIYEGTVYTVEILIPEDYPFNGPIVKFISPISHPNIHPNGILESLIFTDSWSPALKISHIVLTISSILEKPFENDIEL